MEHYDKSGITHPIMNDIFGEGWAHNCKWLQPADTFPDIFIYITVGVYYCPMVPKYTVKSPLSTCPKFLERPQFFSAHVAILFQYNWTWHHSDHRQPALRDHMFWSFKTVNPGHCINSVWMVEMRTITCPQQTLFWEKIQGCTQQYTYMYHMYQNL